MNVLVTGANGFLGRHVVAEFLRRGHTVRALVRPATTDDRLPAALRDPRVTCFRADLRTAPNLPDAFAGVDACVHLAAAVTGGEDAQFAATVVGTEKLLAAMAKSPCKRLVLASSFSVYDWSAIRGRVTEDSPLEPEPDLYDRDGYAVAKLWQERVARRAAEEHNWQLTVLRPGFIWGKGNEDLAGIGQRVGPLQLVFAPHRKLPLTHVENCAHAFVEATVNPAAASQTFNVLDDHLPTAWRYSADYLRGTRTRAIRIPVPHFVAMNATRLARRTSKWIFKGKGKLPSILVPCRFEARFKPVTFPAFPQSRLSQLLHWTPPVPFNECIQRTYSTPSSPQPTPAPVQRQGFESLGLSSAAAPTPARTSP